MLLWIIEGTFGEFCEILEPCPSNVSISPVIVDGTLMPQTARLGHLGTLRLGKLLPEIEIYQPVPHWDYESTNTLFSDRCQYLSALARPQKCPDYKLARSDDPFFFRASLDEKYRGAQPWKAQDEAGRIVSGLEDEQGMLALDMYGLNLLNQTHLDFHTLKSIEKIRVQMHEALKRGSQKEAIRGLP